MTLSGLTQRWAAVGVQKDPFVALQLHQPANISEQQLRVDEE